MTFRWCLLLGWIVIGSGVSTLAGQRKATPPDRPVTTVVIDGLTRTATVEGHDKKYLAGQEIVLERPGRVIAQVRGLNSALYACTVKTEKRALADRDSLASFLGALGPYLPLLVGAPLPPAVAISATRGTKAEISVTDNNKIQIDVSPSIPKLTDTSKRAFVKGDSLRLLLNQVVDLVPVVEIERRQRDLASALAALDGFVLGPGGLIDSRGLAGRGIADFARSGGGRGSLELVKEDFLGRWGSTCRPTGCEEQSRLDTLRARLVSVTMAAAKLRILREANLASADSTAAVRRDTARALLKTMGDVGDIPYTPSLMKHLARIDALAWERGRLLALDHAGKLLDGAEKALQDEPKFRQLIVATDRLRRDIAEAKDAVDCDPVEVLADTARILTVTAAPRSLEAFAAVPLDDPIEFGFVATPGRGTRIAVGLSFLYSGKAIYPTFGTKLNPDSTVTVIQNGQLDNRASYGLTLSVAFRELNHRHRSKWALWLPELTVNPSDGVRAFGVGLGVSHGIAKAGLGVLWTRHGVLDRETPVDKVLPNPDALKTLSRLGPPKLYLSFSLIGLPPFIRSGS